MTTKAKCLKVMCSYCGETKPNTEHFKMVSHGICPVCFVKYYQTEGWIPSAEDTIRVLFDWYSIID